LSTRPVDRADRDRVLVLAPTGRDSKVACALLEQAGLRCATCSAIGELQRELESGAGAAVIAEEAFLAPMPPPCSIGSRTSRPGRTSRSSF